MIIIDQQLEKQPDKAGFIRRDPLVFSCLSRGGKTTVLRELFDKLKKEKKYFAMIVSFNGACGFIRKPAERPEDSILRHIVSQLIDQTAVTQDELLHFQYNEEVFERYLDEQTGYGTSSVVPFIMLIDELNVLGAPLSSLASKLLQRLFLRKNRYLVFTTHVPFSLSNEETVSPIEKKRVMSHSSSCGMKVVRMPQCNDLTELRLMQGCEGLTGHEATIYGGIPALIYSASQNIDFTLNKFTYAMKLFEQLFPTTPAERDKFLTVLLRDFLTEIFDGIGYQTKPYQFSLIPEPGKIRWPLCYLAEILNFLRVSGPYVRPIVKEIYKICRKDIPAFVPTVETGLDWQSVVDVAVLLRALEAFMWKGYHSLVPELSEVKSIQFVPMPDEYRNLEQGQQFIMNLPPQEPGHLYIIRSSFARFPLFDGFLVAVLPMNLKIVGYQVKLERHTPREAVPDWVNGGGVVLRGLAPASSSVKQKGW
eukprot:gene14682-16298_t